MQLTTKREWTTTACVRRVCSQPRIRSIRRASVRGMVVLLIEKVDYFNAARKKGLGNFAEKDIEIRGSSLEEVFQQPYMPYLEGFWVFPEYHFHIKNACSTCQGLTSLTMSKLKSLGEYEKNARIHIDLGRHNKIPEGVDDGKDVFLMGDCTLGLKKKLERAGVKCYWTWGVPSR